MGTPDPTSALFNARFLNVRTPVFGRPQPVEAKIVTVNGTTSVTVDIAPQAVCPLPPGLTAAPTVGERCLVVWSSQGNPWVIGITSLPAPG